MPGFMLGGRRNVSPFIFSAKACNKDIVGNWKDVVQIVATKIPWLTFVLIEY